MFTVELSLTLSMTIQMLCRNKDEMVVVLVEKGIQRRCCQLGAINFVPFRQKMACSESQKVRLDESVRVTAKSRRRYVF